MILKLKGPGADSDSIHHREVRCSQADGDYEGDGGGGGYGDEMM
jgi:hypothetical protein